MGKGNNLINQIGNIFLVYKFRWIILILLIFVAIMMYDITKDLNKERIEKGYTGFFDNVKYDEWTDEIIPKDEIHSYNNDNKYIVNKKSEKIYFYQIKHEINKYEEIQGQHGFIKEKDKDMIDIICKRILNEYLDAEYEWIGTSNSSYEIYIKNYDKYGAYIGATSDLRSFVINKVKLIYNEQN